MMKAGLYLAFPLALCAAGAQASPLTRSKTRLTKGWEAVLSSTLSDQAPSAGWKAEDVPFVEFVPAPGPRSALWFRRSLAVPKEGRVFLRFDWAGQAATLFVDGKKVETWMNGWSPKEVEITSLTRGKSRVEVLVRCDDKAVTYADGFLPENPNAGSQLEGKVLWPLGGYKDAIGLALPVTLVTRPARHLVDSALRITPSFRKKSLTIEGVASGAAEGSRVAFSAVGRDGKAIRLGEAPVQKGRFSLTAPFANAKTWSPEDPHLYRLVSELVGPGGNKEDRSSTRFGFREIWTEGQYFVFNGVRRNLLATSTWPLVENLSKAEITKRLKAVKASNAIAFRLHIGPWQKEWREVADEIGLLIVDEGPLYTDGDGMYAYRDPRFWANYKKVLEGLIGWSWNHPSVVMWSLGNEILFMGNGSRDPELPKKLGDLARFVRKLDPSRPLTFEADIDPDSAYDVIGLHYPHELPSVHAYPLAADWLERGKVTDAGGGLLGTTSSSFRWDRKKPLYIGEYLWVPFGDYSPGTVYFGPEAYRDRDRYNSWARHLSWRDQTIAYRRDGVSGLSPWTAFGFSAGLENVQGREFQRDFYTPVAAFPRFRELRAYSGSQLKLDYDVFNDSIESLNLTLEVRLAGATAKVTDLRMAPAQTASASISLNLPATAKKTTLRGESVLKAGTRTFDRREFVVELEPVGEATAPPGKKVVRVAKAEDLAQAGAWDPATTIVIVQPGVLDPPAVPEAQGLPVVGAEAVPVAPLKAFARRGGQVVVLEHKSLSALGLPVQLVDHASTMAFADDPSWPSLKFWGQDMVVALRQIARTAEGGLRSLASSGGAASLAQTPASMIRWGKGRFVLIQALAGSKEKSDPAARAVIEKAMTAGSGDLPAQEGEVLVVGSDRVKSLLAGLGLKVSSGSRTLSGVVIAGGSPDPALLERIRREKLPVLWLVDSASGWRALAPALGAKGLAFQAGQHTLGWLGRDPLLEGINPEDVTWLTNPSGWDRITSPLIGTAHGALVPPLSGGPAVVIPASSFQGTSVEREGSALIQRRGSPVSAKVKRAKAGWVKVEIQGETLNRARLRLSVNGGAREWLSIEGKSHSTWLLLPSGESEITFHVENAAGWGETGPTLRLERVTLRELAPLGDGTRILAGPGVVAAWDGGGYQVAALTLKEAELEKGGIKARRLLAALCAAMGMEFASGGDGPSPEGISLAGFQIESGPYNSARPEGIELRSAGAAVGSFYLASSGSYVFEVTMEGTPANGIYPELALDLDGVEIGRLKSMGPGPLTLAAPPATLAKGKKQLRIRFVNDGQGENGEDRNVIIRSVKASKRS